MRNYKRIKKYIGKPKFKTETKLSEQPKNKFRILIQQRKSKGSQIESMTSFMVYDFIGRTTSNSLMNRFIKSLK